MPRLALLSFAALALAACGGTSESAADAGQPSSDAATSLDASASRNDAALPGALDASTGALDASVLAPDASPAADAGAYLHPISVAELHAALAPDAGSKDFLLINVHVPFEGNVPGTDTNISYEAPDQIAAYIGGDLDRKVVVYCMSNYMSSIAGWALVAKGYRSIRYLDGGMIAWTAAGFPLEQ